MTIEGKRQSIPLTEGPSRAAARSYLRGVGYTKEELHQPIIGIANTWTEIGTCNMHLREIAEVFGLTESRICQIHSQAILSIRAYLQRFESGLTDRSTAARA
jgi:dihydroxyacid dehydratase/phosphogluconate dehydratase